MYFKIQFDPKDTIPKIFFCLNKSNFIFVKIFNFLLFLKKKDWDR